MLTLLMLLLQADPPQRSIEDAVAAFAKGEAAAREEVLKAGVSSILTLRKVRSLAPANVDALIFEIKTTADMRPTKDVLGALEGVRSLELGEIGFDVAVNDLMEGLPLVFDPPLFRTHFTRHVTVNLKDQSRRRILEEICRQMGLDYGFFYGVILVAEPGRLWPPAPLRPRVTTLTPEESARAAQLIERLGHDEFQVREEAQAELKKLGKDVVPLLKKGAEGEDAERRARCNALVRVLTEPPPGAAFHLPAAARQELAGADEELRKRLTGDMISFKVSDIVLHGALRLMLQPRQIPHQLSPALMNPRLTLDCQNQTAWTLLALATHSCGCDFMIQDGKLVIDTREEIERRVAAGK